MAHHPQCVFDVLSSTARKVALVLCFGSATPIENELDRIDVFYGLGVRSMWFCYCESNMLCGVMGETFVDFGLSDFGYDSIKRMNKVGIPVDVGHTNDRTVRARG